MCPMGVFSFIIVPIAIAGFPLFLIGKCCQYTTKQIQNGFKTDAVTKNIIPSDNDEISKN